MRLGALVIPLTDLPLEDATHNRDGEAGKWCPCLLSITVIAYDVALSSAHYVFPP